MSIVRLTEGARVTRQSVTKHLHVLAGAGLVRSTRVGRDHIWEIEPRRLGEAQRWLDHIAGQWDEALGRLKKSLEDCRPQLSLARVMRMFDGFQHGTQRGAGVADGERRRDTGANILGV